MINCNKCDFWLHDENTPGRGTCRINPPIIPPGSMFSPDLHEQDFRGLWPATKADGCCRAGEALLGRGKLHSSGCCQPEPFGKPTSEEIWAIASGR